MKNTYVKDLVAGSNVSDLFLVKQKSLNKAKNDKYYLAIRLCDNTGEVEARIWDNAEHFSSLFEKGDVVRIIRGSASLYQKRMQLVVGDLEKADDSTVDYSDFMETAKVSPDVMLTELKGYINRVKNKYLKALLDTFFEDDDFIDRFKKASAAKALHHSYIGGLLEHTLSVTKLITLINTNYDGLNCDLLITGAILHDIGKLNELSSDLGFDYTDSGRLLGHIVMGITTIDEKIKGIQGFPKGLSDHVKHMILSHHGIYEWGSPKRPKTLEALVLHYADDLDAKIAMFNVAVKRDIQDNESGWTGYNQIFERYLYKDMNEYLTDEPSSIEEPTPKKGKKEEPVKSQFSMFEDDF